MTGGKVFISYRHDDSGGDARHISDRLRQHFSNRVFLDSDVLRPGEHYFEVIQREIAGCAAFLVVIGPRWLERDGKTRRPRLGDPEDLHRREIAEALQRPGLLVIPVLVAGAKMPTVELPDDVAELQRREAFAFTEQNWDRDLESLVRVLEPVMGASLMPLPTVLAGSSPPAAPFAPATPARERRSWRIPLAFVGGGMAAVLCVAAALQEGTDPLPLPPRLDGVWRYGDSTSVGGMTLNLNSTFQMTPTTGAMTAGRWGIDPQSGAMVLDGTDGRGIRLMCRLSPEDGRFLTFVGACQSALGEGTLATVTRDPSRPVR